MEIDITNKDEQRAAFLKIATEQNKLAHSYLFVDINEQQALNTAYWLACFYNCTGKNKPDGTCPNCRQIISGNYPDVLVVTSENKQSLGIDQIRYLKEELAKSPVQSKIRFFLINEAEKLTLSASNALLNLLEEPIAPVVTILITNNSAQILPTIRSRTQIVSFSCNEHDLGLNERLLENGFKYDEVAELGNTKALAQTCKYFYQEILEDNSLAMVSAHQLADMAKTKVQQNYVLFLLKEMAQNDLVNNKQQVGARFLKYLLQVDKMRYSNVGFRNLLDYLVLQWKR